MLAFFASIKTTLEEAQAEPVSNSGFIEKNYPTKEILNISAEVVRKFGYTKAKTEDGLENVDSTKNRVEILINYFHGHLSNDDENYVKNVIEENNFDYNSEEAVSMTEKALSWIKNQEENSDYMHNLKVVATSEFTSLKRLGILVSLFPAFEKAKQEVRKENSDYIGEIGKRVEVEIDKVSCITAWESSYGTTYVWKITDKNGNILTWKTSTEIDVDNPPAFIKGTVKNHSEYKGVKQTELTRCRI